MSGIFSVQFGLVVHYMHAHCLSAFIGVFVFTDLKFKFDIFW